MRSARIRSGAPLVVATAAALCPAHGRRQAADNKEIVRLATATIRQVRATVGSICAWIYFPCQGGALRIKDGPFGVAVLFSGVEPRTIIPHDATGNARAIKTAARNISGPPPYCTYLSLRAERAAQAAVTGGTIRAPWPWR